MSQDTAVKKKEDVEGDSKKKKKTKKAQHSHAHDHSHKHGENCDHDHDHDHDHGAEPKAPKEPNPHHRALDRSGVAPIDIFHDMSMVKQVMRASDGELPRYGPGAKVFMHFDAWDERGVMLDTSRDPDIGLFELRTGKEFVVPGWEAMVKTMRVGELARFAVKEKWATGYSQLATILRREAKKKKALREGRAPEPEMGGCCGHGMAKNMEENGDLMEVFGHGMIFELEVLRVQEAGSYEKEHWEKSVSEKWTECPRLREQGNGLFKQGKFMAAAKKYGTALGYLEQLGMDKTGEEKREIDELTLTCKSNYVMCKLKLKEYNEVVERCGEILAKAPHNTKAYFRRGTAHLEKGRELELAVADFEKCLSLEPENREAKGQLAAARKKLAEAGKKQNQLFASMFKNDTPAAAAAAGKENAAAPNSGTAPAATAAVATAAAAAAAAPSSSKSSKEAAHAKAAESDDEFFDAQEA